MGRVERASSFFFIFLPTASPFRLSMQAMPNRQFESGKTPMDMAETDEARMILSERRKLDLKCISARAVKKLGIPYMGVVPKILEKYISMH